MTISISILGITFLRRGSLLLFYVVYCGHLTPFCVCLSVHCGILSSQHDRVLLYLRPPAPALWPFFPCMKDILWVFTSI